MNKFVLLDPADDDIVTIDPVRLVDVQEAEVRVGGHYALARRRDGALKGKAFYLSSDGFDWVIGGDDYGVTCLVPLRKL